MSYSIKEIIDIAIGIEQAGYEFYTKCSGKFENQKLEETFTFLAKEELRHKEAFEKMLQNEKDEPGVFTEEYYLYLKAIGGGSIFTKQKIDDIMKTIKTPEEAIKKAFKDEKDSILFYSELKSLYADNPEKNKILNWIIEEERKHVMTLSEVMEYL